MSNQALYIGSAIHLSSRLEQLVIQPKAEGAPPVTRSADTILFVELDHPQVTITQGAMQLLIKNRVAILVTDDRHLPGGLMLPFVGHTLQGRYQIAQFQNQTKLAPALWQKVIQSKIEQQYCCLKRQGMEQLRLKRMTKEVLKGDKSALEGQAARIYFPLMFGDDFLRDPEGETPNTKLNYAYAIIRSLMARSLVCAGLQLAPGIFHKNQYNPFPLADDLMEPYRPIADELVYEYIRDYPEAQEDLIMTKADKQVLLGIIHRPVKQGGRTRPLHQAISQTATSLAECLLGIHSDLELIEPWN